MPAMIASGRPTQTLRVVEVDEHGSTEIAAGELSGPDHARLKLLSDRRALRVTDSRKGWRITAGPVVGVVNLDHVRLVIKPKFVMDTRQLLTWLCYAQSTPVPFQDTTKHWETAGDGYFADLFIRALVSECRTLLDVGLRQDYLRQETLDTALRGRLDIVAQVTRRYGQLDRFHQRTYRREAEIWENQVCAAALHAAARLAVDPGLALDAADTAARFPAFARYDTALDQLERATYNRLNQHYRTSHTWARLILRKGGVTDLLVDAGSTAQTLLLRMDSLWEHVVRRMSADGAKLLQGRIVTAGEANAIRALGDLKSHKPFRPDCLLRFDAAQLCQIPVDAKYKRYDVKAVSSDDLHQMLTYIDGHTHRTLRSAIIVHPTQSPNLHRVLKVSCAQGSLGEIHVLGLDVTKRPEAGANVLNGVLATLVNQ